MRCDSERRHNQEEIEEERRGEREKNRKGLHTVSKKATVKTLSVVDEPDELILQIANKRK